MFAFILGCLYLISALIYLWLIKEKFNIFGFIYNQKNRNFLLIFDVPFLILSFAAISQENHWFLFVIFLMHALNSMTLLIKPQLFYQSKEEMQLIDEDSLNNYFVIMTSVFGVGCLLISYF
ncbi:hypothetical protein N9386_01355 [Gammaproteobacteria bacterium]|nr:hypothetical protein [Gammaproteobacteria bacterium]